MDITVAGYLCIDMVPQFHGAPRPMQEIFRPGVLIDVEGLTLTLGGVVANTGIALKKFGCAVTPMGLVGSDALGDLVITLLARHGIERGVARTPDAKTSFSVVLAPPGADRMFLECCGANDRFSSEHIDFTRAGATRIFHVGYPPLMRRIWNDGGEELAGIFARVREAGSVTSLDMAMVDPHSAAGRCDWRAFLERVLPLVDLFLPSLEELTFMLQPHRHAEIVAGLAGREFVDAAPEGLPDQLCDWVLQRGVSVCCIKMGSRGLHLQTGDAARLNRSGRLNIDAGAWSDRCLPAPALPLERPLVTALGAGDVAIAGLLAALLRGESIERAATFSLLAARDSLYGVDPVGTLRDWDSMREDIGRLGPNCTTR